MRGSGHLTHWFILWAIHLFMTCLNQLFARRPSFWGYNLEGLTSWIKSCLLCKRFSFYGAKVSFHHWLLFHRRAWSHTHLLSNCSEFASIGAAGTSRSCLSTTLAAPWRTTFATSTNQKAAVSQLWSNVWAQCCWLAMRMAFGRNRRGFRRIGFREVPHLGWLEIERTGENCPVYGAYHADLSLS